MRIAEFGEAALLVGFDGDPDEAWVRAHTVANALENRRVTGIVEIIPMHDTVTVAYDPDAISVDALTRIVEESTDASPDPRLSGAATRRFRIPVLINGETAPDLDGLAETNGIKAEEFFDELAGGGFRVRCLGTPAGAPIMKPASWDHQVSRLDTPRVRVPPGSIGLAGEHCIVYPIASPGGWRLVGRTPLVLCDPAADPPTAYRPGDLVEFFRITDAEWDSYVGQTLRASDD